MACLPFCSLKTKWQHQLDYQSFVWRSHKISGTMFFGQRKPNKRYLPMMHSGMFSENQMQHAHLIMSSMVVISWYFGWRFGCFAMNFSVYQFCSQHKDVFPTFIIYDDLWLMLTITQVTSHVHSFRLKRFMVPHFCHFGLSTALRVSVLLTEFDPEATVYIVSLLHILGFVGFIFGTAVWLKG